MLSALGDTTMTLCVRSFLIWTLLCASVAQVAAPARAASVAFHVNTSSQHDYGLLTDLPPTFGAGEFTVEVWIKPDASFPIGDCSGGSAQLQNWCSRDNQPYSALDWWYEGNFLLDGHNNASFGAGTFSLQFYGGGRVRWLFGDGNSAGPGDHWAIGAYPATSAPSLLDGGWHHLALVRRFVSTASSELELYVDGILRANQTSPVRTDMTMWWQGWSGFPAGQAGWFLGAEKQAAIGVLSQYEDYKGLVDELRLWTRAKSAAEIATTWHAPVLGNETGLAAWFGFEEGSGTRSCDRLTSTRCIDLFRMQPGSWSAQGFAQHLFSDGFE
jgi:hypothetical protein